MNFEEYQDMNCWVKLILYLDIDVSAELRLYFSNSHVYDPGMYELHRGFKMSRTCWLAHDRGTGRSHNKLAICLSQLHYKKANYEKWFGMLKPANEVNY